MTTSFTHDSADLAETYDRLSDYQFAGGKRLMGLAGLDVGHRVLDVGCGTGRLARWIAEKVGLEGSVVGLDPLADRVALARAHSSGIAFEVGRAEDLSAFADASFDVVCMSAVFHWVADKAKALAEVRRVLLPGGCLGVTTLSRELTSAGTIAEVMATVLKDAPYLPKVDLSALATASRGHTTTELVSMVVESRLDLAELHVMARTRLHPTGDDLIDFVESSSFGNFLRIVPEELRPTLRSDLVTAFDARKTAEGILVKDWGTLFVAKRPL